MPPNERIQHLATGPMKMFQSVENLFWKELLRSPTGAVTAPGAKMWRPLMLLKKHLTSNPLNRSAAAAFAAIEAVRQVDSDHPLLILLTVVEMTKLV